MHKLGNSFVTNFRHRLIRDSLIFCYISLQEWGLAHTPDSIYASTCMVSNLCLRLKALCTELNITTTTTMTTTTITTTTNIMQVTIVLITECQPLMYGVLQLQQ